MGRTVVRKNAPKRVAKTEEEQRLVIRALLRQHKEGQYSLRKFYELCIKHELTKEPLVPAPHQDILFSFVQHHDMTVLRIPVGCAKTFSMSALALWNTGNDVTERGAIVSASQNQSKKVLSMVADYIDNETLNPPVKLVFPWLRRTTRANEPWTQVQLTVDRPAGIRDPSIVAIGLDGKFAGARLSWFVCDDAIDDMNTATAEGRQKTISAFEGRLVSRLDPAKRKAIVCNTPWHREDLTYHLEKKSGWPTLTMDIYGYIRISNADASWMHHALNEYLRPSELRANDSHDWYRMRAHDPDPEEKIPLWPERYPMSAINEMRYGKDGKSGMMPHEFARLMLCEPFSEEASRCQRDWVEKCKMRGMGKTLVKQYSGGNPTYTGVDLAVGQKKTSDKSVFFTFEKLPDGSRCLLDIESGRFTGPEIIGKIIKKTDQYKSAVSVENNNAQEYIRQFALKERKDLIIRAHTTTRSNKQNVDFGVESIFTELENGAWIIPCDSNGHCVAEVQAWIDDMLYYQPPPAHTGDHLMACWIGREAARRGNHGDPTPTVGRRRNMVAVGGF